MPLVDSLLSAIVRADGDALVLHAGERPYVVAPTGQSDLASRELTLEAMKGMVSQLLPADARQTLDEDGAVQHRLAPLEDSGENFTVVAAKGGEDIWIEIRRHRAQPEVPDVRQVPEMAVPEVVDTPQVAAVPEVAVADDVHAVDVPSPVELTPTVAGEEPDHADVPQVGEIRAVSEYPSSSSDEIPDEMSADVEETIDLGSMSDMPDMPDMTQMFAEVSAVEETAVEAEAGYHHIDAANGHVDDDAQFQRHRPAEAPQTAVVLPLSRSSVRLEHAARPAAVPSDSVGLDRLLRAAASQGASILYLSSRSAPSIRVDGEIRVLDEEPTLTEPDVEAMLNEIAPDEMQDAVRSQAGAEWSCEVPAVGLVRCMTFRDHRGVGGIFRMTPARAISAEQLRLSREIQALCAEAEGLVVVAGPRSSGKSTLLSSFVDLINRTRSDYVITFEQQINYVHENRLSLVSQREIPADDAALLTAVRTALRESPDVLVIEDLRSSDVVTALLEAAQSGLLVIAASTAHTAAEAIQRLVDQAPPDQRPVFRARLAEALRGAVAQVLPRKVGGGRLPVREVLLNTPQIAELIAQGGLTGLAAAIEGGRKQGMISLNDALASCVQSGLLDSREAYRVAADRAGLLASLKRQGVDTAVVERLA